METKRNLLIGAIGLVKGKVRDGGKAMVSICDELEPHFLSSKFLEKAPFQVISLIIRYGYKHGKPEIGKINKRYSELEVAIELPMEEIKGLKYDALRSHFRTSTLESLIAVAHQYDLHHSIWENLRIADN
jgi:Immunity protein 39